MCGGNKGQSQSTQTQTYTPDPQARQYILGAMERANQTANLPFNVPVAPVAGFSQDQQSAFDAVRNAQGQAQPYFNQAADLYNQGATGSNISNFFNPYASAVTDNLKDIFGSQMSQTTGQLTQAAGGVGADRIAVGQSELAKQQGLAAGQTLASLYQPALQAAQSAAFNGASGIAGLGQASQNASLQGANALMGTGGLQQQLAQAQANAPYQWQVAQAAFPYQQSQFLSGSIGSLAPGLGGTTNGQTTSTPAQPSIWSQILGAGTAAFGGLGASGAFGNNGWLTGASQPGTGATYGGYGSGSNGWGSYGGVSYPAFAPGGSVSDDPIDIAANPFVPKTDFVPIKPHVPQLQQSQQSGSGSGGGGIGDLIGGAMKILPFFLARGGSVNPFAAGEGFAFGGDPTDEDRAAGYEMLRRGLGVRAPDSIPGGEAPPAPAEEPFRMPDQAAVDAWRAGADRDRSMGLTTPSLDAAAGPSQRPVSMDIPTETPMSYAPQDRPNMAGLPPEVISGRAKADVSTNPFAPAPQAEKTLADNPWMSLLAAGLGIMGGTSPFAGVNIGQGGQQGLKTLQQQKENAQKDTTIAQAARRLEQEAKFHEDQYSRMTMAQKQAVKQADRPYNELTAAEKLQNEREEKRLANQEKRLNREEWVPAGTIENESGSQPAIMEKSTGRLINAVTGKPPAEGDKVQAKGTKAPITDDDARSIAQRYIDTGNPAMLQGLGYSGSNRAKVNHYIDVIQKEQGISNQELATRTAEWEGRKAGQRVLAQQEAKMGSAAMEAEGAIKLSRGVIERLPRTQFLPVNKLIQGYSEKTLNPDQAELYARTQAIVNTYAAVMSRGASITSDTSRAHAMALLNTANNPETFNRVLDTMLNEIDMAKHSPDRMRRFYRQHYGESAMGKEAPEVSNAPTAPAPKTIARQGTVNSGPNKGKTVIEYSDGTREYR